MPRIALRPGLLIGCAVLSLTACSTVVVGHASPGVAESAGPLARVQQTLDLDKDSGSTSALSYMVASDGVGGVVALSNESGEDTPSRLAHYTTVGGRLKPDPGRGLKQVTSDQELFTSPSGRVVVVGQIGRAHV